MTLLPGSDRINNTTSLLEFPDGQRVPVFYLSGEVGSPVQELLIEFFVRLGFPVREPDANGVADLYPAEMEGWEVRVRRDGQADILCPAPAQGPGVQFTIFDEASMGDVPGCVEAARKVECALVLAGPPLPFGIGSGSGDIFARIGDRPVAGGLVPVTFDSDSPRGAADGSSTARATSRPRPAQGKRAVRKARAARKRRS